MTDQYTDGPMDSDAPDLRIADQQPEAEPLRAERLAPHSINAEEAVLGSAMLNGQVLSELAAFLHADDFFIRRHSIVWEALFALYERNDHIDDLTVIHELETRGQLEQIGGASFITRLLTNTPTYIHAETYGHLVERAAIRRRLIAAAAEIAQAAQDESADINQVIDRAESTLFAVTERNLRRDLLPLRAAISTYYRQVEYQYEHRGEPVGLPTGFNDLDQLLGGIQKSDLLIVAARPGVGKTSFLLSMALNAARLGGARVGIFSMEMSNEQLVQRLVSAETGINSQKLRSGNLDDSEWTLFTQAVVNLGELPMYLDDSPGVTPSQLRAKCRRLYREYGLDLIVVDYLQLMESGMGRNDNRVQEISYISRNLKELARELNVPLVAAAQLSRQVEQRADKRPQLSDLRESGAIEQDADIVMFIYRDDMYNDQSERPNQADIIVAKHRNGPTGVVTLHFNKTLTKFGNLKHDTYNLSG
ncbi:MAG: replicative DNA helicase [Aggregatilineales bacterium]